MNSIAKIWRKILEYLGILKVTIDIGNDEIRIIESYRLWFYFKVVSVKSETVHETDNLAFVIERFLERSSTHKIHRINLTLSSASIIPLFLSFPGIPKEKIRSAVLWEIERSIPLPLEEAYFTYKVVSRIVEKGSPIWNVIAVVGKRDEVDRYLDAFRSMNIIVEEVSYLPINIMSAINIEGSENAVGYVYISERAVELYIMFQKQIVSFSHYIGDFKNITQVTVRNIVDYFAMFIQRRIAFLERIIVIDKQGIASETLIEPLMDALNILTMPADGNDFQTFIRASKQPLEIYDILGFSYDPFLNLKIEPKVVQETHAQDVAYRVAMVIFIVLDILTLMFMPMILAASAKHRVIQLAESTPIEQINDVKVKEMAELLQKIDIIEEYQLKQQDLMNKIRQIKSLGIESSNLKLILVELCHLIPEDVWLKDLTIINGKGEMNGISASSTGIENFVAYLVNSRVIHNVVLSKADMSGSGQSQIKFTVTFEVSR